jgi:uncharacterized tellurite resistance protein B-like protein
MYGKSELSRAIAEMAYVVAKAHDGLHASEKQAFFDMISKELDYDTWAAESRFELLDETTHPTIVQAYNTAINEFRKYKDQLSVEMKQKALKILEHVAQSHKGKHEVEDFIIDQFKKELKIH